MTNFMSIHHGFVCSLYKGGFSFCHWLVTVLHCTSERTVSCIQVKTHFYSLTAAYRTVSPPVTGSQPSLPAPLPLSCGQWWVFCSSSQGEISSSKEEHIFGSIQEWDLLLCRQPLCVQLNFSTYLSITNKKTVPCTKLVIFKKKLPFLLESILGRVRQSSRLCELLQRLRVTSMVALLF